ncbi:MAG TPA: signal peptide peptidase SppA [Candidatus Latescibacteria bacterium]|nr:signal peptide peptidase SppA [Candidatus Latescibacterota bacterium]
MRKSAYVGMIFLFFFLLAAAGTFFLLVMDIGGTARAMPVRGYLEIPLSGAVSEVAAPDSLSSLLLGARPLAMYDLWMNLRKAKVDGRIQAVLLRLGLLQCDWAKANEMREAILDFRRSGKKVYAVIEEAPDFDMEYFVATACDRIILHPLGWLGINGIGGYVPFLKGAFDKLGIRAEFEHVEEYKTAANVFTEKGFTPAHREEMESLYSDLYAQYVTAAAKARGKSEAEFRALVDRAFFQGEKAKTAGLVDDCLYDDEVQALLRQDGRAPARVRFDDYTRVKPSSVGLETGRTVALIYAVGTIMTGESLPPVMGGSTVARWIRTARNDASVKAIVLRIDSPGGSSVGSDVIWREVALAKKVKPVIVSMSDVAGSGGYWIAMAATRIVAQPQTLTGSIGVLAGKFSIDGLLGKLGITSEKLAFGEKADIFSPFRPFTPDERHVLKEEILWTYERFLDKAAEGRGLTRDEVDAVGKGRIWTGRQAKDLKLVDELGGLTMAVGLAKKEAGIDADEEVRFDVWPKKRSFWQAFFSRTGIGLDIKSAAGREKILDTVRIMNRTNIWAIMPFWVGPR